MAKRKEVCYKWARERLYNKDIYYNDFIDDMLIKCNQMFTYHNLPNGVSKSVIEKMLLENGFCVFTKHEERYVVFNGGLGGEPNEYGEPTECIVSNPFLNVNKTYKNGEDCVFMVNDSRMKGLIPKISKNAVMCNDSEISINMLTNILRAQFFITAGDNKSKESADLFIQKLFNGDFSSIADNTFLEGIKVNMPNGSGQYLHQFIELNQYLKATAYNEIGLDANYNMKRERLTSNEIELNSSILIPLIDEMLECREDAIKKINEMFDLNISIELSGIWRMQRESVEKAVQMIQTNDGEKSSEEGEGKYE